MEHLEDETLEQRLTKGALPLESYRADPYREAV